MPIRLLVLPVVLGIGVLVIALAGNLNVLIRLGAGTLAGLLSSFGLTSLLEQFGRDGVTLSFVRQVASECSGRAEKEIDSTLDHD